MLSLVASVIRNPGKPELSTPVGGSGALAWNSTQGRASLVVGHQLIVIPPPKQPAPRPQTLRPQHSVRSRALAISSEKQTDRCSVAAGATTSQHERARRRGSSTYMLRIEHTIHPTLEIGVGTVAGTPSYSVPAQPSVMEANILPNWSREFTVLGRHTLEQLSEIILHLLGWDR